MRGAAESGKYVQRLVRMIGEKEKLIDQLRMAERIRVSGGRRGVDGGSSMEEERLHAELEAARGQMRELVGKMETMETRIGELAVGLREEMDINRTLSAQVQQLQHNQHELREQIETLEMTNLRLGLQKQFLDEKCLENEWFINKCVKQLAQTNKKAEGLSLIEKRLKMTEEELVEAHQLLWEIGQKIEGIHPLIGVEGRNSYTELIHYFGTPFEGQPFFGIKQNITLLLERVEKGLRAVRHQNKGVFLNDTLDGLSMIMSSFEEKLDHLHCLSDRMITQDSKNEVKRNSVYKSTDEQTTSHQIVSSKEKLMPFTLVQSLSAVY